MLADIYRDEWDADELSKSQILEETRAIFGKAIDKGVPRSTSHRTAFKERLKTSTDVFSAFRVHTQAQHMAELMTDEEGNRLPFREWAERVQPYVNHQNRAWLRTEFDTATRRAHNEADWQRFQEEADIYPNLEWVPSTSANPGQDHQPFWGTVLPINDPFWNEHKPGDRWNCKCSLRSTDKAPTRTPSASGKHCDPAPGLNTRPGSGEIFSDDHAYYPRTCGACPFAGSLRALFSNLARRKGNCNQCQAVRKAIDTEKTELIKQRKQEYIKNYRNNPNYKEVAFDKETGALKATHTGHIEHSATKEETFFGDERLTSTMLEKECQSELYKMGHKAILENETLPSSNGSCLTALDCNFNGKMMDIASLTKDALFGYQLVKKNNQLLRYNARNDIKEKSNALILYFHNPAFFSKAEVRKSINFFKHYRDKHGNLVERHLKEVHCVIKGELEVKTYTIE